MPNFIGPDGKTYDFTDAATTPEGLAELAAGGFKPQTEDRGIVESSLSDADEPIQAGVQGALSSLTLGLNDRGPELEMRGHGVDMPGDEERRGLNKFAKGKKRQLKEENPIAYGVGEIAGMVASPVGELGKGVEAAIGAKTVLSKIAASGIRGGVEGSLFGAGNAVSEAALGDTELTAEKLLAGAGLGGMLGAAGGGLGHAVMEGGSALVGKALKGAGDIDLGEFANQRWLKASGGFGKKISDIPVTEHAGTADALRQHLGSTSKLSDAFETMGAERNQHLKSILEQAGITDAEKIAAEMPKDEAVKALEAMQKTASDRFTPIPKAADEAGAVFDYSKLESKLARFTDNLNLAEEKLAAGPLRDIRELMEQAASGKKGGFAGLNSIRSTLAEDAYRIADGNVTNRIKKQLSGILRSEIDEQLAPQISEDLMQEFLRGKKAYQTLSRAEDALGKKTSTGADAVASIVKDLEIASPEAKKFGELTHAMNLTKQGMDAFTKRAVSPSDYLTGIGAAAMSSHPAGALYGLGTAMAHKWVRENGSRLIAKMADQFTKSPALSTIATSFATKASEAAPQMGQYASRIAEAAAISPQHALATHMVMAQADPQYRLHANMAGFLPEDQTEHAGALARASGIASIATNVVDHDEDMEKHLDSIFKGEKAPPSVAGGKDFGAKRMRKGAKDGHEERVEEIMKLASDPAALLERVAGNLGNMSNVAPGVAAALTQKANTAAQYLAGEAKQPQKPGPLAASWTPTEAEKQSFARKYHAVVDPMSVLKHAASGTLTMDEMKALQAVYPRLARLAADQLLLKMAGHNKPVPYKARLMLSMVSGVSADGSTDGVSIARNQAAINAPSKKQDAQGLGDGGKSLGDLKVANRMATPGQRREMRED